MKIIPVKNLPLDINRIELDNLELHPYNDQEIHLYGNVLDIPKTEEYYESTLIKTLIDNIIKEYKHFDELKYFIKPVGKELTIYYYPVILVRVKDGVFTIDAVKGKLILRKTKMKDESTFNIIPIYILLASILTIVATISSEKAGLFIFLIFFLILMFLNYGD